MRILIAEDDLTSRTILAGVLTKNCHEVVSTENGTQALSALTEKDAPRLAILDWMIPEIEGIEVVRRIRADTSLSQPYIIILTSKSEKTDIVSGLDAGADDYLVKPFDPPELIARVAVGQRLVDMQDQLTVQVHKLQQALDDVSTLQGILPICLHCKKIRNDKGYWEQVEAYISKHSEAHFTHGICPECMQTYYPELLPKQENEKP